MKTIIIGLLALTLGGCVTVVTPTAPPATPPPAGDAKPFTSADVTALQDSRDCHAVAALLDQPERTRATHDMDVLTDLRDILKHCLTPGHEGEFVP